MTSIASIMGLHKAVRALWDSSDLDDSFTQFWTATEITQFMALNETEAAPGQPFPYVVFECSPGIVVSRMSKTRDSIWEVQRVPWSFKVLARKIDGDARSPKEIANELMEDILAVFGGHPVTPPTSPTLDYGNFLLSTLTSVVGNRVGDDEYQLTISYSFLIDVPVAHRR